MKTLDARYCEHCGKYTTHDVWLELDYSDGASESHTGNELMEVEYTECQLCGN